MLRPHHVTLSVWSLGLHCCQCCMFCSCTCLGYVCFRGGNSRFALTVCSLRSVALDDLVGDVVLCYVGSLGCLMLIDLAMPVLLSVFCLLHAFAFLLETRQKQTIKQKITSRWKWCEDPSRKAKERKRREWTEIRATRTQQTGLDSILLQVVVLVVPGEVHYPRQRLEVLIHHVIVCMFSAM